MEFWGMDRESSAFVCCFLSDCKDIVACNYRNAEYCFGSESHPLRGVSFVQALSGHTACLETIVPFHNKKLAADVRGGGRESEMRIRETGSLVALSMCVYVYGSGFGMVDVFVE
jgi:hypothetical protein